MPTFLIYEGNPSDPLDQTVRAVEAVDEDEAARSVLGCIAVQRYEEPSLGDPPNIALMMQRSVPVWSM